MEKNLKLLMRELVLARNKKTPKPDYKRLFPDHPAFKYGLDSLVEFEMGPKISIGYRSGITLDKFPNVELLHPSQLKKLLSKMLKLWNAYNIFIDFPDAYPDHLKYCLMLRNWIEPFPLITHGEFHYDGCSGNPEGCEWGEEYCYCRKQFAEIPSKNFGDEFNPN